ncbi:Phenylpropionate dioxygenase, large terminal subunit [Sphingopyxis sp. YR583]|uniref:aromatic ring-hydroxylating oxygenase subunit alpha n=1 Tax=Sphingopyxis sp. YR583 TaxID=1881047 RepID=UPI0008A7AE08|nr:SRPBCC family protein [Sphingopyxis sp. YR583]SEH15284.1 Phenylpropionate dioxygenase, large terminal subunit [Sphingopyxis sp. YR583]
MAESDPKIAPQDWFAVRKRNARAGLRKLVAIVSENRTDRAEGPLPLHKSIYMGEARHAAEMEHIFRNEPIVVGLSGDIPKTGDTLVFDSVGPSILVTRGKDGVARAFLNMCTHRGAKLVEEKEPWSGPRPRLVCPFHAWTFDPAGQLVGQPGKEGFANCEIGARNLIELPCAEHLGLIFVRANPDGEPIDAEAHLGDFGPVLAQLELHRAEPVKKGILTADSNWKFALDTYGESYHFKMLHSSTIGGTHYSDRNVYEPIGRHHRVSFPDLSIGNLVGKDESEWPETDYGGVHFLFPNTVVFFGAVTPGVYFTQLFRLFPDGAGKTVCQFAVYAPFGVEGEEHRKMCEMAYDMTATVVQTEDYRVASNGYANLATAPADFHVVLGANEPALHGVHRSIAAACKMPLDQIA